MTTTCSSGATPNTTGEEASAMCALYTADIEMATVDSLPYADTRQRTHDTDNDGRYPLPCVLPHHTRQRLCRVSPAHAWQKKVSPGLCRAGGGTSGCRVSAHTRQRVYRVWSFAMCLCLTGQHQRGPGSMGLLWARSLPCAHLYHVLSVGSVTMVH
jgi:hypothetical protein